MKLNTGGVIIIAVKFEMVSIQNHAIVTNYVLKEFPRTMAPSLTLDFN